MAFSLLDLAQDQTGISILHDSNLKCTPVERKNDMASVNKKKKARNSYIMNGGEKNDITRWKCKRIAYFTKRDRRLLNNTARVETQAN